MRWIYFKHLARLLWPSASERAYETVLNASPLFDRQFYLDSNPNMRDFYKRNPERHYIQRGEAMGLLPNPDFSPLAYKHHNPDLGPFSDSPLWHYIQTGQAEGRQIRDLPVGQMPEGLVLPKVSAPAPAADFAVVLHLYYPQMWEDIAARLKAQHFTFDLFVTLPEGATHQAIIETAFPKAQVITLPNHGRDMFPFLHLINSGALDGYQAICKLHTKKSPHRTDGDTWRAALLDGVLGDGPVMQQRLDSFMADDTAGLWVAAGQHLSGIRWWGSNRARTLELLSRLNIETDGDDLSFPAGSIYWIKPPVIDALKSMSIGYEDFELELAQVDGTTAHALEHGLGYLVAHLNQRIVESDQLG